MPEQEGAILVEHISTGAEIARSPASDVGIPRACDSRPIKPFAIDLRRFAISREQTKARGVRLCDFLNRLSERLKNGTR